MGLGLHGGGVETVKFLTRKGAKITVTDLRDKKKLAPALLSLKKCKTVKYILGKHRKRDFLRNDIIVKNPGVPPDSPYLKIAKIAGIPVTSDVGIFFKNFPGKIIGVTGTRGKSTTAYLIWKFLQQKYKNKVYIGGNIRKSVLPLLARSGKRDLAVLELSSFQLEDLAQEKISRKSPEIAVLTNIFHDHLNWHKNFKNYIRAKSYIFKFQKPTDYLFVHTDENLIRRTVKSARSKIVRPELPQKLKPLVDTKLGAHYRISVALATSVAKHFRIREKAIWETLKNFRGLEGREEHVATVRGIHFVNDTTSTIPEATIAALERFHKIIAKGKKLILIAGGTDKKLDFKKLAQSIKSLTDRLILLPGTATQKIKLELKNTGENWQLAENMGDALKKALRVAHRGDYVILSPGATSFGQFLNEFDRGEQFVNEIHKFI